MISGIFLHFGRSVCVCVHVALQAAKHACTCMHHTCSLARLSVYLSVWVDVGVYVLLLAHIHAYTHIYIYIYTQTSMNTSIHVPCASMSLYCGDCPKIGL